jgi:hypothetical protein
MLQIRLKEGIDKSWFNPTRDICNAWPKLLKRSLMSFDDFQGIEGCSRDQLLETAGKLGKLTTKLIQEPVDHEMAAKELNDMDRDCPVCMSEIYRVAFHTLNGIFATWIADAKPKTEDDYKIPIVGLDSIAETLAKGAQRKSS